ncbi:sensor histidine kinase [Parafilimonas terrae]|uniref:histidine kinase n=1 Tax=Parafilimonas terrae TaxID=1465490 RepID=A0A1I5TIK7_9BACT|nr:7TM diverse intracellular signaling domain-containing protein [Parafilimonas terrae]SFP82863.1 Signal transduction histidine kinase [Parafilimonas terrae]
MACPEKKVTLILILLFFLHVGNTLLGQQIISHKNTVKAFSLSSLSYYQTNNKNETLKNIVSSYRSGQFTAVVSNVLNAGIPGQYFWVHFTAFNAGDSSEAMIIDINNSRLNEIELFRLTHDTLLSLGKLGDFYPFAERPVPHKDFIYTDSLSGNQRSEYFLFINQVGHTFNLPIKLFDVRDFRSATFKDYLFDGFTYGVLLAIAILSLFFFLNSKHYLYLYYGLYLITGILWFLSYFGLGYEYIWGNYPPLNTAMAPSMASFNICLNLQICQIFLKLYSTNRLLDKLAGFTKYVLLFMAVFPFCINLNAYGYVINHTYLVCFLFTILLAMVIVLIAVVIYSLQGILTARFYLASSLLKAGGIINLALLELGITPAAFNMEELLQTGIFIEIILLTYALALRYSRFKSKTFIKVIEAHENERLLISKEIHDGISSALTGINFGIQNFTRDITGLTNENKARLDKILEELDKVQVEARHISHNTMPDYIDSNPIAVIVEKYIAGMQEKLKQNANGVSYINIHFSCNRQLKPFSEAVKLNIFRIVQEILNNILKHSKASKADILFSFNKKEVVMYVEDDGIGITQENSKKGGMGMKNIHTRVTLLNGDLEIKSPVYKHHPEQEAPDYGTLIKIRIPYRDNTIKTVTGYDY